LALPLALLMPILLPLFYGSAFKAGSTVAETLIVEAILSSAISIHSQTYLAMNRPSVITIFQVIGLALAVPLMLVLIPRIGLEGAALALLLSTCSRYISATLGYAFILKLPIPSILPRRSDIAFLLSAVRRRQEPGIEASSVA
jgi:O-antigen/teichoic acid export membrane protein